MADKRESEILDIARKRLKMAITATSESRADELDDLRFAAGSPDNNWQWPSYALNSRLGVNGDNSTSRPCLTINKLPQHVRQVTNEQRQNGVNMKVSPVSEDASMEMAEILQGVIKHIEYISNADAAYQRRESGQERYGLETLTKSRQ